MILITGATGKLGSAVARALIKLIPASHVAVSVRDPKQATFLKELGIEVRQGDFDDPASLDRSFAGAEHLLLISTNGMDHEKRSQRHCNAIEAARRARVKQVFYTSLLPGPLSNAFVMKAHLDTERNLKASGLPYTILKNGVYAESWPQYLGEGQDVAVPANGPISWVAQCDLAEGIARLIRERGHAGQTLSLTGAEAIDLKTAAAWQGRKFRVVTLEDYVAREVRTGKSEEYARRWASSYACVAQGEFGRVDRLLAFLLTHPLQSAKSILTSASRQDRRPAGALQTR